MSEGLIAICSMRSLEAVLWLCWFYLILGPIFWQRLSRKYTQPLQYPMKMCLVILQLCAGFETSKSHFLQSSTRLGENSQLVLISWTRGKEMQSYKAAQKSCACLLSSIPRIKPDRIRCSQKELFGSAMAFELLGGICSTTRSLSCCFGPYGRENATTI